MGLFDFGGSDRKYKVGDHVRVRYREQQGYVTDIDGNLYLVALMDEYGNEFIETYSEDDLEECI